MPTWLALVVVTVLTIVAVLGLSLSLGTMIFGLGPLSKSFSKHEKRKRERAARKVARGAR